MVRVAKRRDTCTCLYPQAVAGIASIASVMTVSTPSPSSLTRAGSFGDVHSIRESRAWASATRLARGHRRDSRQRHAAAVARGARRIARQVVEQQRARQCGDRVPRGLERLGERRQSGITSASPTGPARRARPPVSRSRPGVSLISTLQNTPCARPARDGAKVGIISPAYLAECQPPASSRDSSRHGSASARRGRSSCARASSRAGGTRRCRRRASRRTRPSCSRAPEADAHRRQRVLGASLPAPRYARTGADEASRELGALPMRRRTGKTCAGSAPNANLVADFRRVSVREPRDDRALPCPTCTSVSALVAPPSRPPLQ